MAKTSEFYVGFEAGQYDVLQKVAEGLTERIFTAYTTVQRRDECLQLLRDLMHWLPELDEETKDDD